MAKMTWDKKPQFYQRKEFKIERFCVVFRQMYDFYYNANPADTDEDDMREDFDAWRMADGTNAHQPLIDAYIKHTGDFISSDREAAAFAATMHFFADRYHPEWA